MRIGLKNRLRLISLFPILILFGLSSYFAYNSYVNSELASLKFLTLTATILIISIILAILGYIFSNEISDNIKNLENVLKKVDKGNIDFSVEEEIDLETSKGIDLAYSLLENIIEQIKKDKVLAQEASEAKSMFLANMSHEIRTPLNGIVGFTELLKDTGLGEEQTEFVGIIEKSSENLLEIINNILDLSKIESNKIEIEDIAFNPIDEFESAVDVYAVRASEKHIDLGFFIDPKLEQPLKGDPTKIKEVIINLLSNAVKFTSTSGAINVDIRKVNTGQTGTTRILFEIQDSGIGVTSEQKSRIFDAFSQADTSITRKYGGTGLGLTISSRFIELMGGKLDLRSEPGKGTTFFFSLEFEDAQATNKVSKQTFSQINALILESSHKSKRQESYLREYLDYLGVNYKTFKSLDELKTIQKEIIYDVIFTDYEFISEELLHKYEELPQAIVLLAKSYFMKKIDSMGFNIFKTIYEPLNITKIKQLLENYNTSKSTPTKPQKETKEISSTNALHFNANVLVAEDNTINQRLIKRTLEDIGLNVTLASNGLEAFQKRKDGDFDLIFMDIQMPHLDGIEATAEIIDYEEDNNQPHIPIIALTANALKGDRNRFLEAGLDEYTTKPLVRSDIIALLNKFLSDFIVEGNQEKKIISRKTTKVQEKPPAIAISKTQVPPKINEDLANIIKANEENEEVSKAQGYKADILLAKKNSFELKIYTKILSELGYSYDTTSTADELNDLTKKYTYKLLLFDENCSGINISELSKNIKNSNSISGLNTYLILISESKNSDNELYVHEIIHNIVNKDILQIIFKKFI